MIQKYALITFSLLCMFMTNSATAQVYEFTTKYNLESMYIADLNELSFDVIDTGRHYTFIADLDKKTISNPVTILSTPEILSITEIIHDAENRSYILKTPAEKGYKFNYYKLQLGEHDDPLYIQRVEKLKGRDMARDTFFKTYTNNLAALSFYKRISLIKDTVINETATETKTQLANLHNQPFRKADQLVEMRDGYIHWTIDGKTRHLKIKYVDLVKEYGSDGITMGCAERNDSEKYEITYVKSVKDLDRYHPGLQRFILIVKLVNGKRTWAALLH